MHHTKNVHSLLLPGIASTTNPVNIVIRKTLHPTFRCTKIQEDNQEGIFARCKILIHTDPFCVPTRFPLHASDQ